MAKTVELSVGNPLHFSVCTIACWTRFPFRVLHSNPGSDSNLLLCSVKMETFVQLFLWGKTEFWEGDLRRSWLLGKRLNYRLDLTECLLNNADILCWYWLFYLVALCSEVFSLFFFPSFFEICWLLWEQCCFGFGWSSVHKCGIKSFMKWVNIYSGWAYMEPDVMVVMITHAE